MRLRSVITGGNVLRYTREPRTFCCWWVLTIGCGYDPLSQWWRFD